ncbi:MAG: CBS domain-containing protein [Planctomycetota bacterium]|jgi:CBS domain-containing protein|nr:CBS domain-containing protein [Planctomycetota bacterium]
MNGTSASRRTSVTIRNIRLTALFKPEDIVAPGDAATDREVIRRLLEHLALAYGIGNINIAMDEVLTSLDKDDVHACPGLAVLYSRLERVADPLIAMAPLEKGMTIAGKTVHLLVVVLTPPDMPGAYKQIRQGIIKTCEGEGEAGRIASLKSSLAIWRHFDSGGHHLPDHLDARHIMAPVDVFLNDQDSLARAIDLFLAHKASELPVLTPDRELIGVVTTRQLVKVCMPDYLMWLEDMTPFLNFEPIAEIIRNESSTWLREIMIHNYAHVVEDSPAILALKEIGRRETDNAYVLRGRKLVGVIKLHEFLSSVLR